MVDVSEYPGMDNTSKNENATNTFFRQLADYASALKQAVVDFLDAINESGEVTEPGDFGVYWSAPNASSPYDVSFNIGDDVIPASPSGPSEALLQMRIGFGPYGDFLEFPDPVTGPNSFESFKINYHEGFGTEAPESEDRWEITF